MNNLITILKRLQAPLLLVLVNVTVLITVASVSFVTSLAGDGVNLATLLLDLPSGPGVIGRPWTPVTYMFTHTDVWHCVFNMLWLYWFGVLFSRLTSGRKLIILYLIGGLTGAAAFTATTLFRTGGASCLEGASAAVMAIVTATALLIPNYRLNFFLLGSVKLKWVAIVTIVLFALGVSGGNASAHWAHLGGVAGGAAYALWLKYVHNRPRISGNRNISSADARAELDALLDKVRTSGYGSLTANERRRLFELSHRV